MTRLRFILCCALFCFVFGLGLARPDAAYGEGNYIPRKLVALYDGLHESNIRENIIHRLLEMPANRLGYDIEYVDVRKPLPKLGSDVHGIIVWFTYESLKEPDAYLAWLDENMKAGKRLIAMEGLGIDSPEALNPESFAHMRQIEERIGVRNLNVWHRLTYNTQITMRDAQMVDFERRITPPFASFMETHTTSQGKSHLRINTTEPGRQKNPEYHEGYADLIITGPQGGYAATGFIYYSQDMGDRNVTQWHLNPFRFLEISLSAPHYPVPDVTTLVGRRIFYAHIDGDGWNNLSLIAGHREKFITSADVIEKDILRAYPDFPFSLSIVAGDVTDNCFGTEKARRTARSSLLLPNVEPTSHTYTHPLYWQFFEDYSTEKEKPFESGYPKKPGVLAQNLEEWFSSSAHAHKHSSSDKARERAQSAADPQNETDIVLSYYDTPRSYNCLPFDEHNEIVTAKEYIESLAPAGKKVKLIQWSGNTSPYERFIRKAREAGMLNINGGESRFDGEYPSYSTLYPLGIKIGNERQVYSTASNENTYTNLWSERFFGYRYLVDTLKHTESPIRVTPFNIYFHSYSGERQASLQALKEIMDTAREEELTPVMSSEYAAIANGFYATKLEVLGENHWRVHNRGALQTLRFDKGQEWLPDENASAGVLGWTLYQGNLYLYLNPSVDKPEIKLIKQPKINKIKVPSLLSLVESRWNIQSAKRIGSDSIEMVMQGYGRGHMTWLIPAPLQEGYNYRVTVKGGNASEASSQDVKIENGKLIYDFNGLDGINPVQVSLQPLKQTQ